MMRLLVALLVTLFSLTTMSEAFLCDQNIINMISEKFWNNGQSIPRNLLKNGAIMSPGSVIRTTKDFYTSEEDLTCAYADYCGSLITFYKQYQYCDNCGCSQNVTVVKDIPVIEENGVLYDAGRQLYLYHLYTNKYGVTVFYRCYTTGECGDPEGLIKVSARGYKEQAVEQAVEDLACLDIYVSDKIYDVSCAKQTS